VSYERRDTFFRDFYASEVLSHLIAGNSSQAVEITATLLQHYDIDVLASDLQMGLEEEKHVYSHR